MNMTHDTKRTRGAAISAALLTALLLAGCSTGHIGETWQCPLAEGGSCDSVAAADPAVPDPGAARTSVPGEPLWRVRGGDAGTVPPENDAPCRTQCGGFDPFAWLARLFDAETVGGDRAAATGPTRLLPIEAPTPTALPAEPAPATLPAGAIPANPEPGAAEPDTAALAAGPDAAEIHARGDDAPAGALRTDEVVARIWIAPFVDADGVYREASHVRVVLEPAGWRLGR